MLQRLFGWMCPGSNQVHTYILVLKPNVVLSKLKHTKNFIDKKNHTVLLTFSPMWSPTISKIVWSCYCVIIHIIVHWPRGALLYMQEQDKWTRASHTMLLCMQSDLKKIPSQLSFTYQWMVSPQFGPQVSPLVRPSPSPVLKTP